ncbi:hypothetical protein ACJ6WD_09815 [Streptomyces sp. VTCC 41912]|uniref:hypothetical protein n=1 Tax=Streptomyces sp. VTCC 41912 TaxID=3383243 RepID=UPI003896BDC7
MPLPAWMNSRRGAARDDRDVWNGKSLPARRVRHDEIHYRIYDARTGDLLSFNSTNALDSLAADVLRTQAENPSSRLRLVQYDGPAY